MRFIEVSNYGGKQFFRLSGKQFFRLTGVKREGFEMMVAVVTQGERAFGRPRKLSGEDQVLLCLSYWREYRSQFHLASSFGVREATVCRTIKKVEKLLLADQRFHLPGKKVLHDGSLELTVLVVDASEQRRGRQRTAD